MSDFALHLLRHGAPVVPGLMLGHTDAAPTASGIRQCIDQAGDLGIRQVISSDLIRAHRPAEAIAKAGLLALTVDARWRELDFGKWDGKHPSEIDPVAIGRFWEDPDTNPPPAGERWSSLVSRVAAAIDALAPVPTLVVTHGGAIRAALHVLCGLSQRQLWAFDLPYGVLLSLRVWPGDRPSAQIAGLYP